jgi:hypothetical protein
MEDEANLFNTMTDDWHRLASAAFFMFWIFAVTSTTPHVTFRIHLFPQHKSNRNQNGLTRHSSAT